MRAFTGMRERQQKAPRGARFEAARNVELANTTPQEDARRAARGPSPSTPAPSPARIAAALCCATRRASSQPCAAPLAGLCRPARACCLRLPHGLQPMRPTRADEHGKAWTSGSGTGNASSRAEPKRDGAESRPRAGGAGTLGPGGAGGDARRPRARGSRARPAQERTRGSPDTRSACNPCSAREREAASAGRPAQIAPLADAENSRACAGTPRANTRANMTLVRPRAASAGAARKAVLLFAPRAAENSRRLPEMRRDPDRHYAAGSANLPTVPTSKKRETRPRAGLHALAGAPFRRARRGGSGDASSRLLQAGPGRRWAWGPPELCTTRQSPTIVQRSPTGAWSMPRPSVASEIAPTAAQNAAATWRQTSEQRSDRWGSESRRNQRRNKRRY